MKLDTVPTETPAIRATSLIVLIRFLSFLDAAIIAKETVKVNLKHKNETIQ